MSWFARSIANTLNFDDEEEGDSIPDRGTEHKQPESPESKSTGSTSPMSPSRGVKEDLSELSQILTRQLWGVASFLAPPPQSETKSEADVSDPPQDKMLGIRGDFAEIGDKFKSGISLLSNNVNVSEITKMASGLLQLESDDESKEIGKRVSSDSVGKGSVGLTEEVVAFARDISMHPGTWLDFPLPGNDDDFDMSDAQQEHALAVEQLAPGLTALRIELCPSYMSESRFWKIYFILLHSRIDEHDAELLSTPQLKVEEVSLVTEMELWQIMLFICRNCKRIKSLQYALIQHIVEARSLLSHELKNQKSIKSENFSWEKTSDQEENAVSLQEQPLSVPSPWLSDHEHENATDLNPASSTATSAAKPASSNVTSASEPICSTATSVSEPGSSTATSSSETGKELVQSNEIPIEDKSITAEKHQVNSGKLYDSEEDDTDEWLKEENIEIDEPTGKSIPIENEDDVSFSDLEEDDADGPTNTRKSNSGSDKDSPDWVRL